MQPLKRPLMAFAGALLAGTALAAMIGAYAGSAAPDSVQQCGALAWRVANRNHSILDSTGFRRTESEAYQTCLRDPAAFVRMMRRGQ